MHEWFQINNIEQIDSPALVVYPERISANIELAKKIAGDAGKLRPHVKTNKMVEVCRLMLKAGISKFKCATIAEAEMLAIAGSPDTLLAYQPVGIKIDRLAKLIKAYPECRFSCLVDNRESAFAMNDLCQKEEITLDVFIDLNTGMNRTGVHPRKAPDLAKAIQSFKNLRLAGLHGYDGHIHEPDIVQRQDEANSSYAIIENVCKEIQYILSSPLLIITGGTPTFPIHARRTNCECSPGTFVFWDWGYKHNYPDMPFEYAALVICRVISIVDDRHVCVDLGYKSVAAESPLPRVYFLNVPEAKPVAHSEEHLVLEVPDSSIYSIGQVFYGTPKHICPTVALYEKAYVIENGSMSGTWEVIARNRYINF
jgi:D-serine deaminase-like pyridoxal phosphate-dependent protein